jgi:intein/homing endonuclease
MPVMALTRREYDGDMIEVRTKMGRRVRCTADHPWIVSDGAAAEPEIKLAHELTTADWVPLAQGRLERDERATALSLVGAAEVAELAPEQLIVRPDPTYVADLVRRPISERRDVFARASSTAARTREVKRARTLRYDELARADISLRGATLGTATNGNFVASEISLDESFWRVVGLYLAEGNCYTDARGRGLLHRLSWSFHPTREQHLVDEVVAFWTRHGVGPAVYKTPTSRLVTVHSRLLGAWWMYVLGLGRTSYTQRLPDLIWDRADRDKWALLSGLWEGDGSWSLINDGPSVILEWGTVSDELADGVMRLLGDVGVVAALRTGRTAKSTKDTYWARVSGAEQIERAIELVPARDREQVLASVRKQTKRIAPTGSRKFGAGPAWVRVVSPTKERFRGPVYSMEVTGAHRFVTTGGVVVSNCFPKDVSALKQLAGNSGYHFQLLNAVIEVNELQKRRVISKLQKHLGSLAGKTVALLGLAFKPETDDMREASSLVLAARLQAEGAKVRAYDPVAEERARGLMPGIELATSALDALAGADACVLVTEWDEFKQLDWVVVADRMAGTLLVDGRNALDPEPIREAGLTYEGIGRR